VVVMPFYRLLFFRKPHNEERFDVNTLLLLSIYEALRPFPSFWAVVCQDLF
jgi:hypothetical protein